MQEDAYRLEGTVVIPEDKKDEFNEYILRILDKCGIRKTDKMELGGQIVTVVRQPMPDEQGIVHFDYSIFEKKIRKQAEYNMNTCELKTPDRGYSEFGIVMNMIMVMQESYSEDHCYFMFKDRPGRVDVYALLIKGVLGIRLEFPNRAKIWDMLFFLKNTEKYEEDERYIPFYKAIQKDYEDEFIEFWEDDDLYFSDDMKKCLSDWKERFMEIKLEDDFNVEIFLAQIITELDHEWGCRLVDRKFVTEFMEHKDDDNYKKALLFYREFMDQDCCYFPELTRKQAIRWVIRNNRRPFDFTAMDAFQSLLINHKYRYEILGF
ncbi:MAG: hypothetical protein HDR71_02985 [Lachnospiraceae bacterium]|nr:hypothetical protein [Lachnospiraceae bacterium]